MPPTRAGRLDRKQARNCALCLALKERAGVTSGRRRRARGGRR